MGGRQEAAHRFLKLTQPIEDAQLPQPRVFEAGKTYEYPFTFAVPEHLLPKACVHKTHHDGVREAHLQVPPSFGDPELSGYGSTLLDDMAPMMAKVLYSIKVQVFKIHPSDDNQLLIVDASKKLRVKPAFEERPPLDLDMYVKHEDYCLRQEKTIRKGMLKGKLGKLVMETSQPKAFKLPAVPAGAPVPAVSTKVKLALRFDPADENTQPPRLGSLNSKLKVATFFASTPRMGYPSRTTLAYDGSQGYISEFLNLSSMCLANVDWRKHESWESPASRRDSAVSEDSAVSTVHSNSSVSVAIPEPSLGYKGKTFYTATILVPLSLPTNKNFVPSFHSCLVSRVYGLHVNLSCNGQAVGSSVTLKLPVQIASEGSVSSLERRRRSLYVEQAQFDADAAFEPRNIGPPPDFFLNQSQLTDGGRSSNEPPSYSFHGFPGMMGSRVPVAS
jgi:hypothetical protein